MTYRAKLGAALPAALLAGTLITPLAYYFPGSAEGVRDDVEQELTDKATPMAAAAGDGYTIEFNGRDGYLTAPAGADVDDLVEQIEAIRGVRDVEVERSGAPAAPAATDDVAAEVPAEFSVAWGAAGLSGNGTLPSDREASIGAGLGDGFDVAVGDQYTMTAGAAAAIDEVIPSIGTDLVDGTLTLIDGDRVRITGTPADADAFARLQAAFGDRDGVELDIGGEPAPAEPDAAAFAFAYDGAAWSQTDGATPESFDYVSVLFGLDATTGENLAVGNNVGRDVSDARRFFGNELTEGSISVDFDQVTVTGVAASAADADAIASAFEGRPNVTLDLEVAEPTTTEVAQAELDALFECCTIEFVTGTATPTAETEDLIDRVAGVLEEFPDVAIDVNGHTDSDGDDALNQELSESRAAAVVQALVARGIDASRMTPAGFGESQPIADNETPEGRQTNRRVEIIAKEGE